LGLQASCLTSSALVKRGVQRLDLEAGAVGVVNDLGELRDLDAPELVNVARVDAVRVCGVAELPHTTTNAKQIRDEETKTHCLLVASKQSAKKPNHPAGGIFLL
jgi:hypothetical protein